MRVWGSSQIIGTGVGRTSPFYKLQWPLLFLCSVILSFCGVDVSDSIQSNEESNISYRLDTNYTNVGENYLWLNIPRSEGMSFEIDGKGFTADVPLGVPNPIVDKVTLSYTEKRLYSFRLKIYSAEGIPLIEEKLSWRFDVVAPSEPLVQFADKMTNQDEVNFLITGNIGRAVTQVWISGDLADPSKVQGSWEDIPKELVVKKKISKNDGVKNFLVKFRDAYGNESQGNFLSIVKESVKPTECKAVAEASYTKSAVIGLSIAATDANKLYYKVKGDIEQPVDWVEFQNSTEVEVRLQGEPGEKKIVIDIHDEAKNFCDTLTVPVILQTKEDTSGPRFIEMDSRWTKEREVQIGHSFDFSGAQPAEMMLWGDLSNLSEPPVWSPFAETSRVTLSEFPGTRRVLVKYRNSDETESPTFLLRTYLQPGVELDGLAPKYRLILSPVEELKHLSVSGCEESYDLVPFSERYGCTPKAETIKVTYTFSDDVTLDSSVDVPK